MKGFKKLALASAVAALPVSGFAMESLDDAALSGVTGQDGLTISLATQLTTDIRIHDTDGFAGALDSGAIVLTGVGLSGTNGTTTVDAPISLTIDAGATGATSVDAALNVVVTLGNVSTDVVIDLGTVSVANSTRQGVATDPWGIVSTSDSGQIMDMGSVTIGGGTTLDIQLGNEITQTHMIEMNTSILGGISLANFSISDAGGAVTGGSIGAAQTLITDAGVGADLTVDVGIDANAAGLVIDLVQLGTAATGIDIQLTDQYLGAAANVVGDVELLGLNLNGTTVTVTGH